MFARKKKGVYLCPINFTFKAEKMNKAKMIDEIIGAAKRQAVCTNSPFDAGDLFFSLAFRTEKELREICKSIGIK